jgi:xanthine dehydrogenase YagR molybdenum-binding subunit
VRRSVPVNTGRAMGVTASPRAAVPSRLLTPALTDYHVPVHADVGDVRALFVDKPETEAHPVGAKGLGEICSVGVSAAIANAVFHATGRRIRTLPITPDKLL